MPFTLQSLDRALEDRGPRISRSVDAVPHSHGALGITDETPLAWWYRHERGARIYDGPDEVHQAAVARHILRARGLPDPRGGA